MTHQNINIQGREYQIIELSLDACPNIALIRQLNGDKSYYYLNKATRKKSMPFYYADKVYNDGYAPVLTQVTETNGRKWQNIQYYNPSQDILIETKFDTRFFAIGEDADKVPDDAFRYTRDGVYLGHKTIVSKYINWNLLVSVDPINFYFVPTEKLQSKGFVKLCKEACHLIGTYSKVLPSSKNTQVSKEYNTIVQKYFSDNTPYKDDDQYVLIEGYNYKDGLNKLFADKIAAAKVVLEARGIQCGDR